MYFMNTGDVSETDISDGSYGHMVRRVIWKGTVGHFRILYDYQKKNVFFFSTKIMKFTK